MFGQLPLPDFVDAWCIVVDGFVLALPDEPLAALAIAAPPPTIAPVRASVTSANRSRLGTLLTPFLVGGTP
jgi:hypothetical protein